jgi:general secretion pathway protein N
MRSDFLRRIFGAKTLLAGLFISNVVAGLAEVPSGPVEPNGIESGLGPIRIDEDRQPSSAPVQSGNPLWAIPLKDLSATRDRPIFSPSRRPPVPAVAAASYVPPPKPPEFDRPQLQLVGTIAGENESFGIFLDRVANTVLRLKMGEGHKGWILREVRGREIVLEKDDKSATLSLPARPTVAPARYDSGEGDSRRSLR